MERFIPKKKLSKKARRKLDRAGRQTWEISPVSRKVKSKKIYDRKRARQPEDGDGLPFYFSRSSHRHIEHHHQSKAERCANRADIGMIPRLRFRDQLFYHHINHGSSGKGKDVRQNRRNKRGK